MYNYAQIRQRIPETQSTRTPARSSRCDKRVGWVIASRSIELSIEPDWSLLRIRSPKRETDRDKDIAWVYMREKKREIWL